MAIILGKQLLNLDLEIYTSYYAFYNMAESSILSYFLVGTAIAIAVVIMAIIRKKRQGF
tara:strand:+ start:68 stop:244 length:177 start_codon:yes stop_codon:yes gene_type:complete